jgi:hypothetical protein
MLIWRDYMDDYIQEDTIIDLKPEPSKEAYFEIRNMSMDEKREEPNNA